MAFFMMGTDMLALGYTKKHGVVCMSFNYKDESVVRFVTELHRLCCYILCFQDRLI